MPELDALREAVEDALEDHLPVASDLAPRLVQAMRYAVLGGGKRIRPLLTCATAMSLGAELESALVPACAIECMHAYSLIHDDLPAMDDDDLRRGQPSCHRAFDDATAILAGDALQALAFELTSTAPGLDSTVRSTMVTKLSQAVGWSGMVGGQALDMEAAGESLDLDALKAMHAAKTGALIALAVQFGTLIAACDAPTAKALTDFGARLGLAFQVVDDLLDVTGDTSTLGKTAGRDAALDKSTFPALLGLDATRQTARNLHARALDDLERAGIDGGPLAQIASWIVDRDR